MPASKRLAAHRLAAADRGDDELEPKNPANPDDADNAETPDKPDRKDKEMAEAEQTAAIEAAKTEARTETTKAMTDRLAAVKAHENFEGREAAAFDLLADAELTNLSAEGIGRLLGNMPKAGGSTTLTEEQQREAAEAAGREEMKAELAKGKNSQVEANDQGGKPDAKAKADSVWDRAYASVDALRQK